MRAFACACGCPGGRVSPPRADRVHWFSYAEWFQSLKCVSSALLLLLSVSVGFGDQLSHLRACVSFKSRSLQKSAFQHAYILLYHSKCVGIPDVFFFSPPHGCSPLEIYLHAVLPPAAY